MATLRVTNLRGRTGNASPTLPDGAIVTGVTTVSYTHLTLPTTPYV